MTNLKIRTPIWSSRSIGIAESKVIGTGDIRVEILYEDRDGERVYPDIYVMSKDRVRKYTYRYIGKTKLYIIPVIDFETYEV
jgi:hypothetical protein